MKCKHMQEIHDLHKQITHDYGVLNKMPMSKNLKEKKQAARLQSDISLAGLRITFLHREIRDLA
jgi:hypothetical protein